MSTQTVLHLLFSILLVVVGCYAIIHEQGLIRFERKAWKYVKAFFKAIYYTITNKEVK